MKKLIVLILSLSVLTGNAQNTDSTDKLAATYFKEAERAAYHQQIWKADVYGPTMFVDPQSRITYANEPDSAGILKPQDDIFKGVLPKEVMIANTSIHWQGKDWSVILWPLPHGRDERVNLVLHESFHRIQTKLGFPERSPTVNHLSSLNGRIYFLLELNALKAALGKPVSQRRADLANALLFRKKRQELFAATFANERILEMSEGLAEYTGMILGRQKDSIMQHLYHQIDTAGNRRSLIRSSAYITGAVYGYLLYQKYPRWTMQIDSGSDFPVLLAKYYHLNLPKQGWHGGLERLGAKYNAAAIIRSEKLKEDKRLQDVSRYVDIFTRQPVLTINLMKMNIVFNPNTVFDLGDHGTVYPTSEINDVWGKLTVTAGGMLMKNWQVVTLPAGGISINGQAVEGKGWTITLNPGWKILKTDELHYRLTQ
ncbi:hypothetical protein [Mucilaginibacter sp. AK015]|uniref:hypothetical protein n=1 Tax=Mucilaginibacter sp. AK015 TaxID=2723072 RepID=UPI00161C3621|nr:hypothetical protein [Mucilaginibacter sp. AK015]MBB5394151.1 hypothetical protein [Mucilaginibacter sp. AK015]